MIDVGKIVGAHGIKGEVKVVSLSSNPARFALGNTVVLADAGERITVSACRRQKDALIIKFKEIADRNQAEAVKGSMLQVSQEEVAPLKEGEYYLFQLENLQVVTAEGETLGVVKDITSQGANDVYRVDMGNGDFLLLPGLKDVITKIDLEAGEMRVNLPPGLLEACKYHED